MANLDLGALKIRIGVDNSEANKQIGETKIKMDSAADSAKKLISSGLGEKFKKGMAAAAKGIAAVTAAAVAAASALVKMAIDTSDSCDKIDKASQRMGVDAEYYQKLEYAVGQCGISMDTMEKAALQLEKAGSDLSFDQAIQEIMNCSSAADRAAKASELFGEKVAYEMAPLINAGADELNGLMQQAEDYGLVLSNDAVAAGAAFGDSLSLMKQSISGAAKAFISEFFPSLTTITSGFADLVAGVEGAEDKIEQGFDEFIAQIDKTLPKLLDMAVTILRKLVVVVARNLPKLVRTCLEAVKDILKSIDGAKFAAAVVDIIVDLIDVITDNIDEILTAVVRIITDIARELSKPATIKKILEAVVKLIAEVAVSLVKNAFMILEAVGEIIGDVVDWIFGGYEEEADEAAKANEDFADSVDKITAATDKGKDVLEDAKRSVIDFKNGIYDNTKAVDKEYDSLADLWKQLQDITDENGNVDESNLTLASNILNVLNQALGTEYELNGNQIVQYGEMCESIDTLIEKKRALAMADVWNSSYTAALAGIDENTAAMSSYSQWLAAANQVLGTLQYGEWLNPGQSPTDLLQEMVDSGLFSISGYGANNQPIYTNNFTGETYSKEEIENNSHDLNYMIDLVNGLTLAYGGLEDATVEYYAYAERYEKAYAAMMQGDYDTAMNIMSTFSAARWYNMEKGHKMTEKELADLKNDLASASWYAAWYKEQFEKGLEGFTAEGLAEAESAANQLGLIWEDAADGVYNDTYEIGRYMNEGIVAGIAASKAAVIAAAAASVSGAIDKMKSVAMIASPSKVTRKFGQYLSEGLALGIDDEAESAANSAEAAMEMVLRMFGLTYSKNAFTFGRSAVNGGSGVLSGGNNITQNNYFTTKETSAYEQELEIRRLNKDLVGVYV